MNDNMLLHTTAILRKGRVEGKGLTTAWHSVADSVKCLVLPATSESRLHENTVIGKDYDVYMNSRADVREGDKLVTSLGVTLLVSGVADYKGIPNVGHIELSCSTAGDR